jgi:putative DNA methylase
VRDYGEIGKKAGEEVNPPHTTLNIEQSFPIHEVNKLASVESYRPDIYRPVNHVHKWWARRLGSVFRAISLATFLPPGEDVWSHYYEKTTFDGKIVLDPFMGSGTTLMETLRLNCQVVGVDINPVAWFSVKKGIEPVSPAALASDFQQIANQVAKPIQDLFHTQCPHCQRNADIAYTLWVKLAPCATCGEITALHTSYTFRRSRQGKHYILCPLCDHLFATTELKAYERCPACGHTFDPKRGPSPGRSETFVCACGARQKILDAVQRKGGPLDYKMYAILYICPVHGRGFKQPTDADLAHFQRTSVQFERSRDNLLIPNQMIPPGEKTDVLIAHGYRRWAELYSPRQLLALSWVLEAIRSLPDTPISLVAFWGLQIGKYSW